MEQEKQVVYFSDLFFSVLRRWKAILIFAVVFAVALGGFQLWRSKKAPVKEPDDTVASSIEYHEQQLEIISANIESQQKYMSESVLMSMNPYSVASITTDVYVLTDYQIMPGMDYQNPDKTVAIIRAYIAQLQTQEALSAYSAATKIDSKFLTELIQTEIISNSNLLSITVRCPDMTTAQALTKAICAQLEKSYEAVSSRITEHTYSILSTPSSDPVNLSVANAQNDANNRLSTLRQTLLDTNTELKELKKYDKEQKSTSPVVMAAIGAFVGACLVMGYVVVRHLVSNKIYSGRVLENRMDVRVLGAVPEKERCCLLHKLEGRAAAPLYDVIAMNICNYCGQQKELLLLGDLPETHKTALKAQLKELGITASFDGSPRTSASALKKLQEDRAVVLIYTCGQSLYPHAEKEIRMVTDHGKALIGCILVNG